MSEAQDARIHELEEMLVAERLALRLALRGSWPEEVADLKAKVEKVLEFLHPGSQPPRCKWGMCDDGIMSWEWRNAQYQKAREILEVPAGDAD